MCWGTTKIEHMTRMTAKEDIPVFKVLSRDADGVYISPYYLYYYDIGKACGSEIYYELIGGGLYIDEGLHSYSTDCTLRIKVGKIRKGVLVFSVKPDIFICNIHGFTCQGVPIIMDAIIPKGSVYYENELGEIVSNQLIITGEADINQFEVIKEEE